MTTLAKNPTAFPAYHTRQTRPSDQPRYVVAKRLNSVRLNWFMFGSLFGMTLCFLCNLGMQQLLSSTDSAAFPAKISSSSAPEILAADKKVLTAAPQAHIITETLPKTSGKQKAEPASDASSNPNIVKHTLKSGETLANLLTDHGIAYSHAHDAINALRKTYNPRNLRAGQNITLTLNRANTEQPTLDALIIATSPIHSVTLTRSKTGAFLAEKREETLEPKMTLAGGTITNSLFETGYENGIPDGVLAEVMQAYSYDVDFQRQIQRGDQVEVLFEKLFTQEGEEAGYGDIIYATLKLRGEPISIYRYEDSAGRAGFYNEKGESVIKALLKTPVSGARISSGFGKRRHPILGYTRMHKGTDFAAATGTPIYAAGDGKIAFAGRKGGYGNYIQIRHNGTYKTAYAHMHRFAKGMRAGRAVKQGQVIGYVGSTGRSTGPHLHYEVHKNGRQVNPMKQKFQTGKVLKGTELANFKQSMTKIKKQVASTPRSSTKLAKAQ